MITVNSIFIEQAVSPLIGGADDEDTIDLHGHFDSNNEKEVKLLCKEILYPEFVKQRPALKAIIKHSLAFYLEYPEKVDFESIFNSLLLPLETPKDSQLFFQWIWDGLFLGESTIYIVKEEVIEDFNRNALIDLLNRDL